MFGEKLFLQITAQYLFYHTSQNVWRNYILPHCIVFINKCSTLSPSQYGFTSSTSTTDALSDLVEAITTISLTTEIQLYGVCDVAQKWIQSYLENTKQCVSFESCDSEVVNISCGVSQVSFL